MRVHVGSSVATSVALASVGLGCGDNAAALDAAAVLDAALVDAPAPDAALDAPPGAPSVTATMPASDAAGVERDDPITATFSTAIAPGTISATTFVLACDGAVRDGAVEYDVGTYTASFRPGIDLALLAACTATITTGVTDTHGTPLAAPHVWSFRIRDGVWSGPERVHVDNTAPESSPRAGVDAAGRATIVWVQDGTVWVNRYVPRAGWDTAKPLGPGAWPALAVAPTGDAVVVAIAPGEGDVWARRFAPGAGWSDATLLDGADGIVENPAVAVDARGNAIAVWSQRDGVATDLWANHLAAGSGWSGPVRIARRDGTAGAPRVALDATGRAAAVWQERAEGRSDVWGSRFAGATGWTAAERLDTATDDNVAYADVALDPAGNGFAVWMSRSDAPARIVWTNRLVATAGWSGAERLDEIADAATDLQPHIALDAAGNAIAVWAMPRPDGDVWARRFEPATGWGPAVPVGDTAVGRPAELDLATSPGGAATIAWNEHVGSELPPPTDTSLWTNRFVPGAGWGSARRVDTDAFIDSRESRLAAGASGDAVVVWIGRRVDDLHDDAWANVFR